MKTPIKILLVALTVVLGISQLQPLLIRSVNAIDGTFGIRPMSHKCLGFVLEANKRASWLPLGQTEFRLGTFHFRYAVTEEDKLGDRPICIGQDLWFGD